MFINLQTRIWHQSTALTTDVSLLANYSGQPTLPLPPQPSCALQIARSKETRVNIITVISQSSFLTESHNSARRDPFLTCGLWSSSRWPRSHIQRRHGTVLSHSAALYKKRSSVPFELNCNIVIHTHTHTQDWAATIPKWFRPGPLSKCFQTHWSTDGLWPACNRQSQPTRFGFSGFHADFHQGVSRNS